MKNKDIVLFTKDILLFTCGVFLVLLVIVLGIVSFRYQQQIEYTKGMCEIINTQVEMIDTISPYFVLYTCSQDELLCEEVKQLEYSDKLNCEDYY